MILTRKELAEKLNCHVTTIDNYRKKGMPVMRAPKSDPKFDWEDVKKWLSEKREVMK